MALQFFPGLHHPGDAIHFERACLSINTVRRRKKPIPKTKIFLDSGAFVELEKYGKYRHSEIEYAVDVWRIHREGVLNLEVVVSQDYMCEPFMLAKTGLTINDHQKLTIERYDNIKNAFSILFAGVGIPFKILPVLQGFSPEEYAAHVRAYGDRLTPGMWVGVGSVCKRQSNPKAILEVLRAIKSVRPDLKLHGFGVKKTALKNLEIQKLLHSADSMAWSYAARKQGRNQNDWREAQAFTRSIKEVCGD